MFILVAPNKIKTEAATVHDDYIQIHTLHYVQLARQVSQI